jgi:chemotaxis protein CheD
MKAEIMVATGEVWATAQKIILKSDAIGSCVVVAAYDVEAGIGSLAHIMLPGSSSLSSRGYNTKYAFDAIEDMLYKMIRLRASREHIEACLVGAGNVLNDANDTICLAVLNSVAGILKEKGIRIVAQAVGGNIRRGISLDIEHGAVHYFEGDGDVALLYKWGYKYG